MKWLKKVKSIFLDPDYSHHTKLLSTVPLFQDLKRRHLGVVYQYLYEHHYYRGEQLFVEGDVGRALFIVKSGTIELVKKDEHRSDQRLALLKESEFFGEMALLQEQPRSASAVAVEESDVYLLYKDKLDSLIHDHPEAGALLLKRLAEMIAARLRVTSEKLLRKAPAV